MSLQAFMAGQTDGLWYDASKTDRLFQEDVGPTPADDPNEVIGLALSQRTTSTKTLAQVIAEATELAINGDFSSATGWTAGGGWSISAGQAAAASSGSLLRPISVVAGRVYCVTYDVVSRTAGSVTPNLSGGSTVNGPASSTVGTKQCFLVAAAGNINLGFTASGSPVLSIDNVTVKEVSRYAATQSTAGFKPKYQTAGAAFDASDDNLLTAYLAQNGANFIVAHVDVPASIPATQVIAGASGAAANRCFLAFNTSGQLCAGVGSDSVTTILGTTDWRGQTVVVGLSFDGSTVKLFAGTAEEYSAAQNSTPTTAIPFRIGALNNNGTAGSFSGVFLKDLLVGRQALTLAQFKSIRTQLLAGA